MSHLNEGKTESTTKSIAFSDFFSILKECKQNLSKIGAPIEEIFADYQLFTTEHAEAQLSHARWCSKLDELAAPSDLPRNDDFVADEFSAGFDSFLDIIRKYSDFAAPLLESFFDKPGFYTKVFNAKKEGHHCLKLLITACPLYSDYIIDRILDDKAAFAQIFTDMYQLKNIFGKKEFESPEAYKRKIAKLINHFYENHEAFDNLFKGNDSSTDFDFPELDCCAGRFSCKFLSNKPELESFNLKIQEYNKLIFRHIVLKRKDKDICHFIGSPAYLSVIKKHIMEHDPEIEYNFLLRILSSKKSIKKYLCKDLYSLSNFIILFRGQHRGMIIEALFKDTSLLTRFFTPQSLQNGTAREFLANDDAVTCLSLASIVTEPFKDRESLTPKLDTKQTSKAVISFEKESIATALSTAGLHAEQSRSARRAFNVEQIDQADKPDASFCRVS